MKRENEQKRAKETEIWTLSTFRSKLFNQYTTTGNNISSQKGQSRSFMFFSVRFGNFNVYILVTWPVRRAMTTENTHIQYKENGKVVFFFFGVNLFLINTPSTKSFSLFTMVKNFPFPISLFPLSFPIPLSSSVFEFNV